MQERLYKELIRYSKDKVYPFHMPGHKRNLKDGFLKDAYEIDITEIDGFDNLHDAKEIILEAEKDAAEIYHSEETHFLVNGSSCGILSAIYSVTGKGNKIIVARNCHTSVYNGILLNELVPVYLYPKTVTENRIASVITPEQVEESILNNPDAKAVLITSPTYDGVISDVAKIAKICHEFNIPLIVDEAHGALFYIEGRSAVINGADIVINSLHKTLPALTSTALIHVNGGLIDRNRIKKYLKIFQTSSPSYVLMASIDYAMDIMEKEGARLYRDHCIRICRIKEAASKLRNIELINQETLILEGVYDFDESKLLFSTVNSPISGKELGDILINDYKLQAEMTTVNYALLMLTVLDSDEGIDRLINALNEIDNKLSLNLYNHKEEAVRLNPLKDRIGEISEKTVYAYPPGIPIILEGEVITKEIVDEIDEDLKANLEVKGL